MYTYYRALAHCFLLRILFLVSATHNPIVQEVTVPRPCAQLDRFLRYERIGYPAADAEGEIPRQARERARQGLQVEAAAAERISQDNVFAARAAVLDLHLAPQLERYLIELVLASRDAARYDPALEVGRASCRDRVCQSV